MWFAEFSGLLEPSVRNNMQSLCDGETPQESHSVWVQPPPNIDYKDLGLLGNVRKGVELVDLDRRMRWRVTALLEPAPSL